MLEDLELTSEMVRGKRFYRGAGCEVCNNTGYKGRLGLFELMIMNNDLRDKIMANAQTDELRTLAIKHGMVSLRHAGIQSCFDGITTPDEVVRRIARVIHLLPYSECSLHERLQRIAARTEDQH